MRASRVVGVALTLAAVAVGGLVVAEREGLVALPGGGTRTAVPAPVALPPPVAPVAVTPPTRPPVLEPAGPADPAGRDALPVPSQAGVATALAALLTDPVLGTRVVAHVVDVATGTQVYDRGGGTPVLPASTAKLVTGAAALRVLGPTARFSTTVLSGATPGELVLVGGGDPLLAGPTARPGYPAPARLAELATATAAALRPSSSTVTRLVVDGSLFTGPRLPPGWKPSYFTEGSVSVVTALMVDSGRVRPGRLPRHAEPDLAAGAEFARLLRAAGIAVTGPVARGSAPPGARRLAQVASPPVAAIVERMLLRSDNDAAEALARHVALRSGQPATPAGGSASVRAAVGALGLDVTALRVADGSGLSRASVVQPYALARLLALAAGQAHPELRPLLTGLPVAGFDGTLEERFDDPLSLPAAGVARAKTGTLLGVSALAGVVRDRSGRLLAVAVVADRVPVGATRRAEEALDRIAAALAACGCP